MIKTTERTGGLGRLAGQSVAYAFRQLGNDRFRTFLALLGVSIGVFCVTASTGIVNSLQNSMREGLKEFGTDAVFIEKIPIEPDLDEDGTFKWWKYVSRPEPDLHDSRILEEKCKLAESVSFSAQYEGGKILGVTENWRTVVRNPLAEGREFSLNELQSGAAVAIVGSEIYTERQDYVAVNGRIARIIGRFESSGINSVSLTDIDGAIVVPYGWVRGIGETVPDKQTITVLPAGNADYGMFLVELRQVLRQSHRLLPGNEDDFAMNRLSFVLEEMDGLFGTITAIGWMIGLFSLVIGTFGIANIMFVNVRERTREIGLQMALGARKSIIVVQYLTEAVTLSVIGGLAGLAVLALLFRLLPPELNNGAMTEIGITAMAVSISAGLISGIAPALEAASLEPAVALRK